MVKKPKKAKKITVKDLNTKKNPKGGHDFKFSPDVPVRLK